MQPDLERRIPIGKMEILLRRIFFYHTLIIRGEYPTLNPDILDTLEILERQFKELGDGHRLKVRYNPPEVSQAISDFRVYIKKEILDWLGQK